RERFERSLALTQQVGGTGRRYPQLHSLGEVELRAGNVDRARALLQEALELACSDRSALFEAQIEHGLGDTALASDDTPAAERHYRRSLSIARDHDQLRLIALCLAGLAALAAKHGDPARSGRLWGASEAFQQSSGSEMLALDRSQYER